MNILVTGAAGFIGQHLVSKLIANGDCVVGLYHDRVAHDLPCAQVQGNILDFRRMLEIIVDWEIDQIYHLASKAIVRNCRLDPVNCMNVNVMGTATILEAARQSDRVTGILVAESDKSYGSGPVPYKESQAIVPEAIYETSKACVSHLMRAYAVNYQVPVTSVRCANVYGAGDPNHSRLVPRTILRLLDGKRPQITTGAERFRREFVYVGDACDAYQKIMAAGKWGQTFNVGSGECHTVREAIQLICRAMGKENITPEEWDRPKTLLEIKDQWLCIDKLLSIWPEYQPRTMTDALPSIIDWYRRNSIV
jgi:nucleoside-diphosphate-sugar epimerase